MDIESSDRATTNGHTSWDAAAPVLLNTWKHHAGALRHYIQQAHERDVDELPQLGERMVVMGNGLTDLYLGALTPAEIGRQVITRLSADARLSLEAYQPWISDGGGYHVIDLSDSSRWVLRLGDASDRHVHVHPGRNAPHTRRVRANALRTAVMVIAVCNAHGGELHDLRWINQIRREFLTLPPIGKKRAAHEGLDSVIDLLRSEEAQQ